ncbi:cytochrome P450 6a2-like [Diorhabda sublineata]|uniref:cytochrome P450 6a2-like n=1 Tax=Diorhabda sublineata TaxID=1163346 RepID=UPI0024E0FB3A|nr:cytochrome P450 6a2-like [Diorhabda sublineata]XP_056647979.1 cytochrome P450 6a2-like [Diorhabda sublineata]XP_056647980.1 cytochrome P450 6a2-like [Diorhabda sublineata]
MYWICEFVMNVILVLFICSLSIYAYFLYSYKYWARRKIPYLEPRFPYGNRRELLCYTKGFCLELMDLYTQIKNRGWKFGGFYGVVWPIFMVTDPQYIKDILKKDFQYFIDRGFYYQKYQPITHHLFNVDEVLWKNLRTKLTPTFTSGKMKMMFPLIDQTTEGLLGAIEKSIDKKQDIDSKECMSMFTIDVIVSCAFGLNSDCFNDPNHKFRHIGKEILTRRNILELLALIISNFAPDLALKMRLPSTKPEALKFFKDIISQTIQYRKENNVKRDDFLQLVMNLMEETQDTDFPFTLDQLVANVILFFVAGFDTSSSALNFSLYELARNQDIQDKLRNEIQDTLKKSDGKLTYDTLNQMSYLQQVIDESLRLYPSVPILQRKSVKEYTLRDTDKVLEKGTLITIPIISLHRDHEYFPNPLQYDPDRFSPENKHTLNQDCYLPFGDGPRNCIGSRFGLMQVKTGLVRILSKYKVNVSPSMKIPVQLDERVFLIQTTEPIFLRFERV